MSKSHEEEPDDKPKGFIEDTPAARAVRWIVLAIGCTIILISIHVSFHSPGIRDLPGVGRIVNNLWPQCERIDEVTARKIGLAKMDISVLRFTGPSARQDFYDSLELCPQCIKVWDGRKSNFRLSDSWEVNVSYSRVSASLFDSDGTFRSHKIRGHGGVVVLDRCGNKIHESYGG